MKSTGRVGWVNSILVLSTTVQLTKHSNESWKIKQGEMIGCLDMGSSGYFHVSRDTLQ